jgi:hypothetical protein
MFTEAELSLQSLWIRKYFKGLVAVCHSFCLFLYFITFIQYNHPITFIQYIRRGLSPSPHRSVAQWERPPCGAEPGIELGPAFQQADALPTEPRRTIKPRRTIMSHAAP